MSSDSEETLGDPYYERVTYCKDTQAKTTEPNFCYACGRALTIRPSIAQTSTTLNNGRPSVESQPLVLRLKVAEEDTKQIHSVRQRGADRNWAFTIVSFLLGLIFGGGVMFVGLLSIPPWIFGGDVED